MNEYANCPFCVDLCEVHDAPHKSFSFYKVECENCGSFDIDVSLFENPPQKETLEILARVRKLRNRDGYFLQNTDKVEIVDNCYPPISLKDFLSEFPQGVEIFDKALLNLATRWPSVHEPLEFNKGPSFDEYAYLFYSIDDKGSRQIFQILQDMGYVSVNGSQQYISAEGWKRIQSLQEETDSTTAFVAMWFNEKTELFRKSVKTAVKLAGYSPEEILVDEAHHNDYIMDKVINMIDDSRFVIADFTCSPEEPDGEGIKGGVRGGVYFEAGYARGKGRPVIHTCRGDEDSNKRRHFDIDQINTIFWKEENGILKTKEHNLIEVLKERIVATVGHGPLSE